MSALVTCHAGREGRSCREGRCITVLLVGGITGTMHLSLSLPRLLPLQNLPAGVFSLSFWDLYPHLPVRPQPLRHLPSSGTLKEAPALGSVPHCLLIKVGATERTRYCGAGLLAGQTAAPHAKEGGGAAHGRTLERRAG